MSYLQYLRQQNLDGMIGAIDEIVLLTLIGYKMAVQQSPRVEDLPDPGFDPNLELYVCWRCDYACDTKQELSEHVCGPIGGAL